MSLAPSRSTRKPARASSAKRAEAARLAEERLDRMGDRSVTEGERQQRKKGLLKGPRNAGICGRISPTERDEMSEQIVRDSNGNQLNDGDSVTVIKDLKVKGSSETIKRGTLVKGIRLTHNLHEVECNTRQVKGLVLRTEFLKKA